MADDPDFRELLEEFVGEIPDRIALIENAMASADIATLRRLSHQLKGACGGYGFPTLTNDAAVIESAIDRGLPAQQINEMIEDFLGKLRNVVAEPE